MGSVVKLFLANGLSWLRTSRDFETRRGSKRWPPRSSPCRRRLVCPAADAKPEATRRNKPADLRSLVALREANAGVISYASSIAIKKRWQYLRLGYSSG